MERKDFKRQIFLLGKHRIIEVFDHTSTFEDLCGDSYKPEANPNTPPPQLLKEEQAFSKIVEREGVYGYVWQEWNPEAGSGWQHVDSCFGFVGEYKSTGVFNHYIVQEMKEQIEILNSKEEI